VTSEPTLPQPSDVLATQLRTIRRQRGLTAGQLAQRCSEAGLSDLTAQSISNIETGRRDAAGKRRRYVTVEELLALAFALNVAPVDLLVPGTAETEPYLVTPAHTASSSTVREWISGNWPVGVKGDESAALHGFTGPMPADRRDKVMRRWLHDQAPPASPGARVVLDYLAEASRVFEETGKLPGDDKEGDR
jgi:transcriptional regulator with XRE-family HTH domain